MVVPTHYIDEDEVGYARVNPFLYPHSGDRLAISLPKTVEKMDPLLLSSMWTTTVDNATNNGSMGR